VGARELTENSIWPITANRDGDGVMQVGDCDVRDLVAQFQTPLFVLDETDFRQRCADYQQAYRQVYYASKAFACVGALRWVTEEGLGVDVCTGGELAVAMRAGVSGEHLIMHGNNKSLTEIREAIDYGVKLIVLDSFEEIARVQFVSDEAQVTQQVLIRVTPGVEAHTHEYIATAHEDQKFGFALAGGVALEAVKRVKLLPNLELVGLHVHIGSQIFDATGFEVAAQRLADFAAQLHVEEGVAISMLNLGGGMGISYMPGDDPLSVSEMSSQLTNIVETVFAQHKLATPLIAVEPGRAIAGPAMITIYEVGTVKTIALEDGTKRVYISVDGGMSDNIRTALYEAEYSVALASRESSAPLVLSRVVGKHCETGDVVVRDAMLPSDIAPGDLLAVAATGAYCRAMASNYNYLPRPAVVGVKGGKSEVLLRRETMADLLLLEPN
jgi:diaminopimelate decarboxylase